MAAKTKAAERFMLAAHVGMTKRYLKDGLTAPEIAKKMNKPESSVRKWISIVEESEKNKAMKG